MYDYCKKHGSSRVPQSLNVGYDVLVQSQIEENGHLVNVLQVVPFENPNRDLDYRSFEIGNILASGVSPQNSDFLLNRSSINLSVSINKFLNSIEHES